MPMKVFSCIVRECYGYFDVGGKVWRNGMGIYGVRNVIDLLWCPVDLWF